MLTTTLSFGLWIFESLSLWVISSNLPLIVQWSFITSLTHSQNHQDRRNSPLSHRHHRLLNLPLLALDYSKYAWDRYTMWFTVITVQRAQEEYYHIFSQLIARQRLLLADDSDEIQRIHLIHLYHQFICIYICDCHNPISSSTHLPSSSLRISLLSWFFYYHSASCMSSGIHTVESTINSQHQYNETKKGKERNTNSSVV